MARFTDLDIEQQYTIINGATGAAEPFVYYGRSAMNRDWPDGSEARYFASYTAHVTTLAEIAR